MASILEIYNSKFDQEKNIRGNNFFDSEKQISELNNSQRKYISNIDYSDPKNFIKFGSAQVYYNNAIKYITNNYPFDASSEEKNNWVNSLNEFEYHVFKFDMPKSVGHIALSGSQYLNINSHVKDPSDNPKSIFKQGSYYTNNTLLDFKKGITFESWLKFEDNTQDSNIVSISAVTSSNNEYITASLLNVARKTGDEPKIFIFNDLQSYNFETTIPINEWHHYAITIKSGSASLYIDGSFKEKIDNLYINALVDDYIFVPLGLMTVPLFYKREVDEDFNKTSVFNIGGGEKTYFDDCRMWGEERTPEKIGRFWFTSIDGNNLKDIENVNLLFYYKFNEGWDKEYRYICLDSSGRKNDAEIVNFSLDCIKEESAINAFISGSEQSEYIFFAEPTGLTPIVTSTISPSETEDVIIAGLDYSENIKNYYNQKILSGSLYDQENIHSLYNKLPSWILLEEDSQEVKHLKQLMDIVSYYFDDLYNKISEMTNYKKINYESDLSKIYPFYDKILTSTGFDITDIFRDLSQLEKISSRTEKNKFSAEVDKVKNAIYKNIYNNITYILKSKGTEKAIKSFLRTFGVDENLIKVNLYADGGSFDSSDKSQETVVRKKTVTLKNDNIIKLSGEIEESEAFTLEVCLNLSKNLNIINNSTSSILGIKNSLNNEYYVTLEKYNDNKSRIIFNKFDGVADSKSFLINNYNIYDGSNWNFCIRKKAAVDTLKGSPIDREYEIEFYALNDNSYTRQEFSCSFNYTKSDSLTYYLGAKKDNLNNVIYEANSVFLYCNYWTDYINNQTIESHNRDILNYGVDE